MSGFFGMPPVRCLMYMAITGILGFWLGRILPKQWFRYERFPLRAFSFEREGRLYHNLGIQWWKEKLPDMSRILPNAIPSKRLPPSASVAQVEDAIRETCMAEFIHGLLCVTGLRLLTLWKGLGGRIMYLLYLLGNVPFCIIQRYNRPRLVRILQRKKEKEGQLLRI